MKPELPRLITRSLRVLAAIEDGLLVGFLLILIIMAGSQIIMRNLLGMGFVDMDTLSRLMVLWLGMLGAVVASRNKRHISVDLLTPRLPKKIRLFVEMVMELFAAVVCALITYYSFIFIQIESEYGTFIVSGVPSWAALLIIPAAFALITFHYLINALATAHGARQVGKPL